MVSQSLIARKATRGQIISGLQPSLFLPQASLLGRVSAGTGGPETITIGANLTVAAGVISAPAAFSVAATAPGAPVQPADLVAVSQGGQNTNLPYSAFMAGLSNIAGVNVSALSVTPNGAPAARTLAAIAADAISVAAFGALGDGLTDDTIAFGLALASGRPIRLDAKIYIVNGPLYITRPTALLGVPQGTVIRRLTVVNENEWISVSAPSIYAVGTIFDGNALAASNAPNVLVAATCDTASFFECGFINACGATYGAGLSLQCGASATHVVASCMMTNNALHGATAAGVGSVVVTSCTAIGNGGCGVNIGNGVAAALSGNICSSNQCGISLGGWASNPPVLTTAGAIAVSRNSCFDNGNWGMAIACAGGLITDNFLSGNGGVSIGGGLLARLAGGRLSGNIVVGGAVGIDARGASGTSVSENSISGATSGLLAGGSQNTWIGQNFLSSNVSGIVVSGIEPSLGPLPTSAVTLESNWVGLTVAQGSGISILDGAQTIAVVDNNINGWGSASIAQALWVHTESAIVRGNTWNNVTRFPISVATIANLPTLVVPDVADDAFVLAAPPEVQSILTNHQVSTLGQVLFIRVLSGGTSYTQATVSIAGSGSGAEAQAIVENGSVIWITVTNPGSGYGSIGAAVAVSIGGDGAGATAQGYVGAPVIEGKRLRLACNTAIRLVQAGSVPPQTSWTGFDTTVPAMGAVELEGTYGQWRAVQCPPVDYLAPTGDGGAVLQSVSGADLTLRPSSGGSLQIASAAEPTGYVTSVGRGSPEGAITAPPGSDYRNLDGGVGSTLWIKQVGTDNQGWSAIA
jgi:hypothetical protein